MFVVSIFAECLNTHR